MDTLIRKVRGALGIGLTWGAGRAVIMAVIGLGIGILRPQDVDPGEVPLLVASIMAAIGFVSGVGFGILLS